MENIIKEQLRLANNAVEEMKKQNNLFETMIKQTLQGAPEEDKKAIQKFQLMTQKALKLAQEGKITEAENIIKQFKNGG